MSITVDMETCNSLKSASSLAPLRSTETKVLACEAHSDRRCSSAASRAALATRRSSASVESIRSAMATTVCHCVDVQGTEDPETCFFMMTTTTKRMIREDAIRKQSFFSRVSSFYFTRYGNIYYRKEVRVSYPVGVIRVYSVIYIASEIKRRFGHLL